ncbi:Serine protease family S01A [Phytophthora palmivora]|uniref:Serine protease family S01A n=1 Tax=Phytophthora palmivora TaxID=4796 RepID=A0A2P4X6Y3_9STRA|nr:Serine protease family S01A [Phytophthora palmivora]
MKFVTALVAVVATLASSSVNAQPTTSSLASDLITVPVTEIKAGKPYVTGVRSTKDGTNFCAGALIGPSHVLTTASCIPNNIRWVSIGSDSYTGADTGEQIKVVAFLVHPNNTGFQNDFLILELEEESTLTPVIMDPATTIVTSGTKGGRLGWNDTTAEAVQSRYLQSVEVQLVSNEICSTELTIDETNLCSRGVSATKSCMGDEGGAVIVQKKKRDVLVGLVSSNAGCGKVGGMSVYSSVASVRPWIDSIIKGICVA